MDNTFKQAANKATNDEATCRQHIAQDVQQERHNQYDKIQTAQTFFARKDNQQTKSIDDYSSNTRFHSLYPRNTVTIDRKRRHTIVLILRFSQDSIHVVVPITLRSSVQTLVFCFFLIVSCLPVLCSLSVSCSSLSSVLLSLSLDSMLMLGLLRLSNTRLTLHLHILLLLFLL